MTATKKKEKSYDAKNTKGAAVFVSYKHQKSFISNLFLCSQRSFFFMPHRYFIHRVLHSSAFYKKDNVVVRSEKRKLLR